MFLGYARVSTREQNLDLQIKALQNAQCDKIFTERASGAQRERPELQNLLSYARYRDTIVIWKLDRLARSLKRLIETVELLESRGIGLKSLTESLDTTTSGGRLIFHIFGALAEFERSIIRERTVAGLQAAKAMGRVGGRPSSLSDKDLTMIKTLLRDENLTVAEIARRMNVSHATLYRYLPAARSEMKE